MKNQRNVLCCLTMLLAGLVYFPVQGQQQLADSAAQSLGPNRISRTVIKDKKGNIWIAAFDGMFKYDGESFTHVTRDVSSARFFSVLQDRKGGMWFTSIGSGVYHYNGKLFRNLTTGDGLASDGVAAVYEDKAGRVWFGTGNGASRYDGKSFKHIKMKEVPAATQADSLHASVYLTRLPENSWMHNDVNAIMEDNSGMLWFGTRGYASIYDGKKFTTITNNEGKPFANVRSIIKDKKGNIWLGGYDGLWRYDGSTFTNLAKKFVGYIYEDKNGNIWTSSESADGKGWALSRYDGTSLAAEKPTVVEIAREPMLFGISEDDKGNIWFGAFNGVYRYDGKSVTKMPDLKNGC